VGEARRALANALGVAPGELIFTSGATESNNLAIAGLFDSETVRDGHVITVATEHKSVLEPVEAWRKAGANVTVLAVNKEGRIDESELERALQPNTRLVSVMAANNEVGVIHPIPRLVNLVKSHSQAFFHCDLVQAFGRLQVNLQEWGVDLASVSAHKIYGPQGVGALFVRSIPKVPIRPGTLGGGQERGLRAGTLNVAGIVGFGAAAELAMADLDEEVARLTRLSTLFHKLLLERLEGVFLNGDSRFRVAGNLSLRFEGVDSEVLMTHLPHLAMSTGSACTSSAPGPSHVLTALGLTPEQADETVRISLGRFTTDRDVRNAAHAIAQAVQHIRTGGR
jgi:cysteine desulfurase